MADPHPLRAAGGAGRVDDVAEVLLLVGLGNRWALLRLGRDQLRELVEPDHSKVPRQPAEHVVEGRFREERGDFGVARDVGQPVRGEAGIEGNERGAQLQGGQHPDISENRGVEQQRHPVAGADPMATGEEPSQLIRTRVELYIGEASRGPVDRQGVRAPLGEKVVAAAFKELLEALAPAPANRFARRTRPQQRNSSALRAHRASDGPILPHAQQEPSGHWFISTLDPNGLRFTENRCALNQSRCRRAEHHTPRRSHRLHPLSHPDLLTDSGVTERS